MLLLSKSFMYFLFVYFLLNKRSRSDDIATSNAVKTRKDKQKIWQQYRRFTFVISCNAVFILLYSNVLILCEQSKAVTLLQKFIVSCQLFSNITYTSPCHPESIQYFFPNK